MIDLVNERFKRALNLVEMDEYERHRPLWFSGAIFH